VDNQNEDSSKVKTHEEILKLFHEVQSVEEKIKNPDKSKEESDRIETILQQIKPSVQIPDSAAEERRPIEPVGEIPLKEKDETKKSFLEKIDKPEIPSEKKPHWFDFLKPEKNDIQELEPLLEAVPQPEEIAILRSTFILQLDNDGNLTGFPMKKLQREKKTRQGTEEADEPVKGIKGILKHITSRFRHKNSDESESSGGIGDKIKGIFRRKNKD
jgi:G3E family GTPase